MAAPGCWRGRSRAVLSVRARAPHYLSRGIILEMTIYTHSLASDTCRDLEYLVQCPKSIRRRAQCMSHNMFPLLCAFQAIKNKMAQERGGNSGSWTFFIIVCFPKLLVKKVRAPRNAARTWVSSDIKYHKFLISGARPTVVIIIK